MTAAVLLAIALVVWLWWWGDQPAPNTIESPEHLAQHLRFLLDRGTSLGEMVVRCKGDRQKELWFRKYIRAPGDVGMNAVFRARSLQDFEFDDVIRELRDRRISFTEDVDRGLRRVSVDCGHDVGLAQLISRLILERSLRLRIERDCIALFYRVLIDNVPRLTGVPNSPVDSRDGSN